MASSIRIARLKGEAEAAVKSMKLIATKADEEARDLTEDEQAEFDKYKTQAEELVKNLEAARHDVEVISAAETLAKQVGAEPVEEPTSDDTTKAKAQSLGLQVVGSAQFKSAMAPYKAPARSPSVRASRPTRSASRACSSAARPPRAARSSRPSRPASSRCSAARN